MYSNDKVDDLQAVREAGLKERDLLLINGETKNVDVDIEKLMDSGITKTWKEEATRIFRNPLVAGRPIYNINR